MALTYRSEKGSALTNTELDNNFRHFTGSHSITGSLTVSGSVIPADVSGTLGTADNPWKSLYVDQGTIYFISGSSSGSMSWNSSSGFVFDSSSLQSLDVSGNSIFSGSVTISGSNTLTNIGPFITTGESTFNGDIWIKSTSGNVGELSITSLTNNYTSSFYTDNSGNLNIVSNGNNVVFKAGNNGVQATIPFTASSTVSLPNISNTTTPNIVGYDTSTGQLSYYSTSSFGSVSGSVGNLQQVTDVGATTTNTIEVAGLTSNGNAEFSGSVKVYSGSVSVIYPESYQIHSPLNNIYSGSLSWTESNAFKLLSNFSYYNRLHISNSAGPQLVLGDEYNSINIGSGSGGANIGNASRFGNSVAIGNEALANLNQANGQVAIGHKAGYSDRSSYGVYVGLNAGEGITTYSGTNTAIGAFALSASRPSGQIGNTALGYFAGTRNSGSGNTYIGHEAGGLTVVGGTHYPSSSRSIFIGYRAGWNPNTGSDGDNMIVINAVDDPDGYGGGKGSNTAVLGNHKITHTYLYGTITEPSGLHVATSSAYNTDINFKNLPTSSTGLDTGSLWLSGSDGAGSQFLMVYNP